MKRTTVMPCESEEHLEQYLTFVCRFRSELLSSMYPTETAKYFLRMIGQQFRDGTAYVCFDDNGTVAGAFTLVFDAEAATATIYTALLREDFRNNVGFVIGMIGIADAVEGSGIPVRELYFTADRKNVYVQRIYRKFAQPYEELSNELLQCYHLRFDDYKRFAERFEKVARRNMGSR